MKVLLNCLAIGAAGFLGALCRYGVNAASVRLFGRGFPVGTLFVNLTGSFVLAFFAAWCAQRASVSETMRLAVATGFVGAYTTFSTFMFESDELYRQGAAGTAVANVVGSVLLGLLAVRLGAIAGARV